MSTTYWSEVGILICLHTTAKPLPMMFIRTADTAAGTAVKGDAKWMVARTTPKDEFCIPTCQYGFKTGLNSRISDRVFMGMYL
jgi:hypothetical protein